MNKIIYSLKVMLRLVELGHIPIATMENPKFPEYKCWVFENNEKFQQDLDNVLGGFEDGQA